MIIINTIAVGDLVTSVQHVLLTHPFIWAAYRQQTAASIAPENEINRVTHMK